MQTVIDTAKFLAAGEGKMLSIVGETITLKFTGGDTAGAFSLFEGLTPPHGGPPPHLHRWEDETFFVLDGKLEFNVGGQAIEAGPGDSVFCPKDVPHCFRNIGDTAARTLTIVSPAGFERFFERADALLRRDGEVTPQQLAELGSEYGLEFLGA